MIIMINPGRLLFCFTVEMEFALTWFTTCLLLFGFMSWPVLPGLHCKFWNLFQEKFKQLGFDYSSGGKQAEIGRWQEALPQFLVFVWQPNILETLESLSSIEHSQQWLTQFVELSDCPCFYSQCCQLYLASSSSSSQNPDGM